MEDLCPRCGHAIADGSICPNCSYPYEQNEQTYTGSNEFATQYVNSVYKLYSGATAIVSGIESGSSDLWNSGLEELQEGIAQETELTKLALANLEKTATLLTKGDAIDDILKEWNPASQSE